MFLNLIGRKSGTIFLDQSHNEIKQNQRIHGLLSKLSLKYCPFCNGIFFALFCCFSRYGDQFVTILFQAPSDPSGDFNTQM